MALERRHRELEGGGLVDAAWVQRIAKLAESEGRALDHPVVVMHNQTAPMPATLQALPIVIRYFWSRGYTFVNLLGQSGPPKSCGLFPTSVPSAQLPSGTGSTAVRSLSRRTGSSSC